VVAGAGAQPVKVIPASLKGPLGLVWIGKTLYVSSLGYVTAFSGLVGHHFAERRTIVIGPVAGIENNNLVEAPDGRLVLGVTANCDHCTPKSRWAGSIVSFRTDGSDLRLYARRIRAPYGLEFFPGTSDLFASMNQRDDLGAKTPGDALAVVRAGQDWKFPACYDQGGAACAGVPAVLATLDKHAAAGGVAIATGQLGSAIGTSALVSEWELGKVLGVPLTAQGTRAGKPTTVLTGFKSPLPLLLTAGKALFVGDWTTGRIYRISVSG
jgi:glucose/arabinose dehydrogenase